VKPEKKNIKATARPQTFETLEPRICLSTGQPFFVPSVNMIDAGAFRAGILSLSPIHQSPAAVNESGTALDGGTNESSTYPRESIFKDSIQSSSLSTAPDPTSDADTETASGFYESVSYCGSSTWLGAGGSAADAQQGSPGITFVKASQLKKSGSLNDSTPSMTMVFLIETKQAYDQSFHDGTFGSPLHASNPAQSEGAPAGTDPSNAPAPAGGFSGDGSSAGISISPWSLRGKQGTNFASRLTFERPFDHTGKAFDEALQSSQGGINQTPLFATTAQSALGIAGNKTITTVASQPVLPLGTTADRNPDPLQIAAAKAVNAGLVANQLSAGISGFSHSGESSDRARITFATIRNQFDADFLAASRSFHLGMNPVTVLQSTEMLEQLLLANVSALAEVADESVSRIYGESRMFWSEIGVVLGAGILVGTYAIRDRDSRSNISCRKIPARMTCVGELPLKTGDHF
jgi:hypothetical protein